MTKQIKKTCSACGSSPINHRLMFFLRFTNEIVGKLTYIYSPLFSLGKNVRLADFVEKMLLNLLYFVGAISYDIDIEKTINGRSKLIWEEAIKRGIDMKQIFLFGKPIDHFKAKINGGIVFFQSIPIPPWLSHKGYDWVDDKFLFAKKFEKIGIPSPKTRKIIFLKKAYSVFDSLNKPIIIKPQFGSLGRHTTTNINTKEELEKAYYLARQITFSMIAQEHLFGSVYRATVVNNILVGFFRADPPFVIGDGIKSIEKLIFEKNKNRKDKLSEILINEELLDFIQRQGLFVNSILEKDKKIDLLAKTGRFYGGYTKEMLPEIHPKFHSIFRKASEFVSIPVAGFDLIIKDPTKDPDTQRWGIIECNSLPFIDLHAFSLEGEPVNIAEYIWNLWNHNPE
ncbi:MAG: hypothetical protein WCS86_03455 [Candidatus Paceibacterota bacterium]